MRLVESVTDDRADKRDRVEHRDKKKKTQIGHIEREQKRVVNDYVVLFSLLILSCFPSKGNCNNQLFESAIRWTPCRRVIEEGVRRKEKEESDADSMHLVCLQRKGKKIVS